MISICIPIYNYNVSSLISELHHQMSFLDRSVELILIDDCSETDFKIINRNIKGTHQYIELPSNVGRSKIRNLFLKYAHNNYLLFLDCDVIIENPLFLENYIQILPCNNPVVCGGHQYPTKKPNKKYQLRWYYGIHRESKTSEERNKMPNRSFMTSNFLIQKELFQRLQFDERLTQYGHEDTLFGYELKKNGISITHIDNNIVIGDNETNLNFLIKTELGIQNILKILEFTNFDPQLIDNIVLLKTYKKIKWLKPILKPIFKLTIPIIRQWLSKWGSSVSLFNIYKLGLLIDN